MPMSRRWGTRKVLTLFSRADFLEGRINAHKQFEDRHWDRRELSALIWAIKQLIELEEIVFAMKQREKDELRKKRYTFSFFKLSFTLTIS